MNRRVKGMRNERRAQEMLRSQGYETFRLYQPRGQEQGCVDIIAVNSEVVRFIQSRTNRWGDLRELKAMAVPKYATKEVWMFKDGEKEPRQRVLESN